MWSEVMMFVVSTATVGAGAIRSISKDSLETKRGTPGMDTRSAMMFPVTASIALMVMYFFFTHIQYFIIVYMMAASFGSLAFFCLPPATWIVRTVFERLRFHGSRRRDMLEDRAMKVATVISGVIVATWLLTGHWALNNLMGISLCVLIITLVPIPSLRVATICLGMLFFYDIFWVFFSEYIFEENVMVKVATKVADNPLQNVGQYLGIPGAQNAARKLELPVKLMFPEFGTTRSSMLGLGDMALPGLLVAYALTCDIHLARLATRAAAAAAASAATAATGASGDSGRNGPMTDDGGDGGDGRDGDHAQPLASEHDSGGNNRGGGDEEEGGEIEMVGLLRDSTSQEGRSQGDVGGGGGGGGG